MAVSAIRILTPGGQHAVRPRCGAERRRHTARLLNRRSDQQGNPGALCAAGVDLSSGYERARARITMAHWSRCTDRGIAQRRPATRSSTFRGTRPLSFPETRWIFVSGWLVGGTNWGRPVDVAVAPDGGIYISDDQSGTIYKLVYSSAPAPSPPGSIASFTYFQLQRVQLLFRRLRLLQCDSWSWTFGDGLSGSGCYCVACVCQEGFIYSDSVDPALWVAITASKMLSIPTQRVVSIA